MTTICPAPMSAELDDHAPLRVRPVETAGPADPFAPEAGSRAGTLRLALLVSVVVSFLAGSSAPTPLYATYQREWGFSLITTTVVFGVYALAVLAGLLVLGRLSDHVGRRPVILAAIAGQIVAMLIFAQASGVDALLLGRVVQGVAAGGALGALGAAMIDVSPHHGTHANAAAPGAGTGFGAIASALVVTYLPSPTHTIYLLLAAVLVAQFVAVALALSRGERRPGALRALNPRLRVPAATRGALLTATPVLFAVWSLAGFYGAIAPSLLTTLSGRTSVVLGGLGLFLLAAVASVSTIALRNASAGFVLWTGLAGLALGSLGAVAAIAAHSSVWFLLATLPAGIGFGSGFQGGLRTILAVTPPAERAGVLSALFVVSYIGLGAPAVVAGWLVVHGQSLHAVADGYAAFVLVLAAITGAVTAARRRVVVES